MVLITSEQFVSCRDQEYLSAGGQLPMYTSHYRHLMLLSRMRMLGHVFGAKMPPNASGNKDDSRRPESVHEEIVLFCLDRCHLPRYV